MNQDKLMRELRFIEESFKSGIISNEEYTAAKKRIQDKLAPEENAGVAEVKVEQEKPIDESAKLEAYEQPTPSRVKLETYETRPKINPNLIYLGLLLLVVILFFTFWRGGTAQEPVGIEEEFIPECKADLDCYMSGFVGICLNPGTEEAECDFEEAAPVSITVLSDQACKVCDTKRMQNTLKQIYPGAEFDLVDVSGSEGKSLLEKHNIEIIPAYIIDEEVENTKRFATTQNALVQSGSSYLMKPTATGSPYFFEKHENPESVTLFMDPLSTASIEAFNNIMQLSRDFNLEIAYFRGDKTLDKEIQTQLCIRENSPAKLFIYMQCLFDNDITSQYSFECMQTLNIPATVVEDCIETDSASLFEQDLALAKGFYINSVPAFVINNQYKKGGSLSPELLDEFYCKVNEC